MKTWLFSRRERGCGSDMKSLVIRAAALGFAAGLRSQVANAALARQYDQAPRSAGWRGWMPFRWPAARTIMWFSAIGEAIGDKLPIVPSRLTPGPLGGRIIFGAFAGAAIGSEYRADSAVGLGAVLGGSAALAGSFVGSRARTHITSRYGLPDLPVALIEDGLAAGIATRAVR